MNLVRLALRALLLFGFSHRFLAITRWELHFIALRIRNAISFQPLRIRLFLRSRRNPILLNLGSGPRGIEDEHWVNVDGFHDRNIHFEIDLSRRLPFPSETFDGVFCEHVLEHFSIEDGERLAREICRVMRPGSSLRVVIPDAELVLRRYFETPEELVTARGSGSETPMQVVNEYFRQRYEHQFLYDWATAEVVLRKAGFSVVLRVSYKQSTLSPLIVLDDGKYEWESLYLEAQKQ